METELLSAIMTEDEINEAKEAAVFLEARHPTATRKPLALEIEKWIAAAENFALAIRALLPIWETIEKNDPRRNLPLYAYALKVKIGHMVTTRKNLA